MSRYIDADRLIYELNRRGIEYRADINKIILTMPTADVEPVKHGKYEHGKYEWIKKDEVMDIIKGLPKDLWEEYIYMLKGVWCDEDMLIDVEPVDRKRKE